MTYNNKPIRTKEETAQLKAKFGRTRTESWGQECEIEVEEKKFTSIAPVMMPMALSGCRSNRDNNPEYVPAPQQGYNKPTTTGHSYATKRNRKSAWVKTVSSSDQIAGRRYKQHRMDVRVVYSHNVRPCNAM